MPTNAGEESGRIALVDSANASQASRPTTTSGAGAQQNLLWETLASIGDGVICSDSTGCVAFLNEVAETLTGWKTEEARGRPIAEIFRIVREESRDAEVSPAIRAVQENRVVGLSNHALLLTRDGNEHSVEHTASPLRDQSGAAAGSVVVFRDVTDRRTTEKALRASRSRSEWQRRIYEAILTNTPDLAYVWDLDHRFIYANEGLLKMWGKTWDQAIGKHCLELGYEPWHAAMHDREIEQVVQTRRPVRGQVPFTGTFGRRIYDYILVPVIDSNGEVEAVAGTTRDITEHKLSEMRIRTSEERVRLATEAAELAIWVWDLISDDVTWENERAYAIFGLPNGTKPVNAAQFKSDFVLEEDADEFQRCVNEAIQKRDKFVFRGRIRRTDGTIRWVEFIGRPVPAIDDSAPKMHGTAEDVTERVLAEEQARLAGELNAKMRSVFEQGTQFAAMLSLDGRVVEANKASLESCGFTRDDVIGKLFWKCGWWNRSPELMEKIRDASIRAAEGQTFRCECKYFVADGSERYIDLSVAPVRDENGTILFVSPTGTDITDRKAAEAQLALHKNELEARVEERTRELMETHHRLRMAERMASMGAMSAGLGHDMGNLLMPVRVRLDSLEESADTPQAKEDIKAIRTSAEYLQRLANGLRLLSLDPERARVGDVTELCSWWDDAHGVMQSVLPRGVVLEADFPKGECRTAISKAALTQVVFNLVQNAGDAMAEQAASKGAGQGLGKVRVRGWCEGDWVLVSVSDDGPGMTDTVKARCMEPFFTTKTRGISTGLGLVLVYGLVREAGGEVELQSEFGKGTTFTLRLPLAKTHEIGSGGTGVRKYAALFVKDARLHSFVGGELRAFGFEVLGRDEPAANPAIVVADDLELLPSNLAGCRVLLLGKEVGAVKSGGSIISLGEKPPIAAIREALRSLASGAGADTAQERPRGDSNGR